LFGGVQSDDDNYALEAGMALWDSVHENITIDALSASVRGLLKPLRRLSGSGVRIPLMQ
jgi:hypothetical protein